MSNAVREFLLFAPFEGVPKSITRWMVSRLAEFCVPWGWLKQAASHVNLRPTQKVRWSFCWTTKPQLKLLQSLQNFKKSYEATILVSYWMKSTLGCSKQLLSFISPPGSTFTGTTCLDNGTEKRRPSTACHLQILWNLSTQLFSVRIEKPPPHWLSWYVIMGALSLSDNTDNTGSGDV